jgi:hypothetical protein
MEASMVDREEDGIPAELRELLAKLVADQAAFDRGAVEHQLEVDRELLRHIYDTRKMLLNAARMLAKLSGRVQELENQLDQRR